MVDGQMDGIPNAEAHAEVGRANEGQGGSVLGRGLGLRLGRVDVFHGLPSDATGRRGVCLTDNFVSQSI
jgi:hypothetical protein